jgi:hypothetical protein
MEAGSLSTDVLETDDRQRSGILERGELRMARDLPRLSEQGGRPELARRREGLEP